MREREALEVEGQDMMPADDMARSEIALESPSLWKRSAVLLRDLRVSVGLLVIVAVVLAAIFAPALAPHDPNRINALQRLQGPGGGYWLGTDNFGRDIFSRLLYGARMSMIVALGSMAIACTVGVFFGLVAGTVRGWADTIIMRGTDALLSFPPIVLAYAALGLTGASLEAVIVVIGLLYVPRFVRITYGAVLAIRNHDYVQAAWAMGATLWRIIPFTILPNTLAPILVQLTLGFGHAILLESGLSFLGVGPPPPEPSWGRMVGVGRSYMAEQPHFVIWPSVVISMTVLAFNLIGDALRDYTDPKASKR